MPLREHVYCVEVAFKMTEWVEQWICLKFCVKLEHSSIETILMIQRLQLWATGDWQLHHSSMPAHASHLMQRFCQNIKSSRWLSPTTAQIWCPVTSGFSPNQNHLWKGRDFRLRGDSEKYDVAADGDWENCVRSHGAYFEGDWGTIVLCTMLLVSCVFFNKCVYFSLKNG